MKRIMKHVVPVVLALMAIGTATVPATAAAKSAGGPIRVNCYYALNGPIAEVVSHEDYYFVSMSSYSDGALVDTFVLDSQYFHSTGQFTALTVAAGDTLVLTYSDVAGGQLETVSGIC